MLNYEKFLNETILDILNNDLEKKKKLEKSLIDYAISLQNNVADNEINEFVKSVNQMVTESNPNLTVSILKRTKENLTADKKDVFSFNKTLSLTENFIQLLQQKESIVSEVLNIANQKSDKLQLFDNFLNDKVYPFIQDYLSFKNNIYFKNILKYEFKAKYVEVEKSAYNTIYANVRNKQSSSQIYLQVELSYISDATNIDVKPITINFNSEITESEERSLIIKMISLLETVLKDIENQDMKKVELQIALNPLLKKENVKVKYTRWENPEKYTFDRYLKRFYVTVAYLSMTDEEKEAFNYVVANTNIIQNIFSKYPSIFERDLKLTLDNTVTDSYSLEKRAFNLHFPVDSTTFTKLANDLVSKIDSVIDFETKNVIPSDDFSVLYRYFIKKIDERVIGADHYVIYKFRGTRKRIFNRGFKNGKLMSTNQLAKYFRKIYKTHS